ncbi:iron ABC transporter permease [soil metagenome]
MAASALVAACFAAPFGYLLLRAAGLGEVFWQRLADAGALAPLLRTLLLGATVSTATAALGLACAWLVARTDLPGRGAWAVLLALPLVLPSYIGAFTLRAAFAPGGLLDEVLAPVVSVSLPVEGFWAAFGVLTLLTFPYVYLPTAARLRQVPAALEESARLLGRGPWATFRTVVLPQCRGAVLAGALLVFLYTISDFGAVQLLRYDTLTRVIFASVLDQAGAVTFSLQLGVLALAVVAAERLVTAADRGAARPLARGARPLRVRLGRWRSPSVAFVGGVVAACLLAPVTVLAYWAARGIASSGPASSLGAAPVPLLGSLVNTAGAGLAAAVAAVLVVLPVAYLTVRHRGRVAGAANAVVVGGFALPGLVIALTLVVVTLRGPLLLASAYQTLPLLVFAYVVHFGAQSLRAAQVGVAAIPPRVDDAARLLGAGRLRRLLVVDLPLLAPALLAGAGLVLLSTMKELPATLLLAPAGFSTLATDIWNLTEEAFWADASLAALLLVALSGVLTWALVLRRADALA